MQDKDEKNECYVQYNRNSRLCARKWESTEECNRLASSFPQRCVDWLSASPHSAESCEQAQEDLIDACDGSLPRFLVYKTLTIKYLYNFSQVE